MIHTIPVLSYLLWLPIIGGFFLLCLQSTKNRRLAYFIALSISLSCFLLCCVLLKGMDCQTAEMQWCEHLPWIPPLQVYYSLGVDALSALLITLTVFISLIVIIRAVHVHQSPATLAVFLIIQGFICGAFSALDAILFYVFWEAALIPIFLMIGIWGGGGRLYASMQFFLYTLFGSVLLLAAILYLHQQHIANNLLWTHSFSILAFQTLTLDLRSQQWLFFAFLLAFGIKLPLWPLHSWLPAAHTEASSGGSMILAAILLKMGAYGFLRFILPIVPDASRFFANTMIGLALIAMVLIALIALVQVDLKKTIAYSSISHMGFFTLGLFSIYSIPFAAQVAHHSALCHTTDLSLGLSGAVLQLISHGLISAALFLCVGILYERLQTHLIQKQGGLIYTMPVFSTYFMIFILANIALPGTSAFVSEFLIFLTAVKVHRIVAVVALPTVFLGAVYHLWLYKRVILGPVASLKHLADLQWLDQGFCLLFAGLIIGLGLYPNPLLHFIQSFIDQLLKQMLMCKI